jgi:cellulose synthase/poly-beta-1,6-N-acetylglucosamine synthase-like glycosyltransferase
MILEILSLTLIGVLLFVTLWSVYNMPILAMGVKDFRKKRPKLQRANIPKELLPTFSIVVPVKNEGNVVGRLLTALSKLDYPAEKIEIIVVEDGSTDKTLDICLSYSKEHMNVKILHRSVSDGKPSALNYGLKHVKGDIVAVFDADSVPDPLALLKAAEYFKEEKVAAVQGKTQSLNSMENMLTQFISYEEAVWCEAYLRGKDTLNLFVHLRGSCQFIRRIVLEKLEGFSEDFLSEDMEISAKLVDNGYRIRYASDVLSWQESPSNLKTLFKQRTRWFRGTMEVALKYGKLMAKLNRINLDAETTLFGPFVLIASLLSYVVASGVVVANFPFNVAWVAFLTFSALTTTLTLLFCGFALVYVSKPRRIGNLSWLPFVFGYWTLQGFIALYAAFLILFRRPKKWIRTEKRGIVSSGFVLEKR